MRLLPIPIRPMWKVFSLLVLGALLSACVAPTRSVQALEEFGEFFSKTQQDPTFRAGRISTQLAVTEEMTWGDGERIEVRAVSCGPAEIEAHGWELLPGPERLQATSTSYSSPVPHSNGKVVVSLGPPDGGPDAEYTFESQAGAWYLIQVEVFTGLEAGAPVPPLPCGSTGHRPNEKG